MSIEEIYKEVVAAGAPVALPEPWQALASDRSFFRLMDPAALLKTLRSTFEDSLLVESGVVQPGDDGAAAMNPLLASPGTIVWALRKEADAPPFSLIADLKSVRPKRWAFASVFSDYQTSPMIEDAGDRVAVVFSMEELAILWGLKVPAVPACGLEFMPGAILDTFCKVVGLERPEASETQASADKKSKGLGLARILVLFDWSVSCIEPRGNQNAEAIWKYWRDLQQHLGLPVDEYERIRPTEREFARLRFLIEHRGWDQIRDTIFEGPYDNVDSLLVLPSQQRELPNSLSDALQAWRRTFMTPAPDVAARKSAWSDVRSIYERHHVDVLLEQASKTSDPLERSMVLALADVSKLLHPQMVQLTERISQAVGEKGAGAVNAVPMEEFQQVMAGVDRLMALQQGVQACRAKKPFQMVRVSRPKATTFDSKDSGSAPKNSPPSGGKGSSPGKREGGR